MVLDYERNHCVRTHKKYSQQKVKSVVGVADDDEKGGLSVAYGVKLHFVGFHKLPQLLNVEWG